MKKMNRKGFTLIELLAVITIMGILMLVAIPAVSRTIENSRRDSFANITNEYIKAVRNAVLADDIKCYQSTKADGTEETQVVTSATKDGTYYIELNSSGTVVQDLMESGGKSSYGGAEMIGYVKWVKVTDGTTGKTTTTYTIRMQDSGGHGLRKPDASAPDDDSKAKYEFSESELKRANIMSGITSTAVTVPEKPSATNNVHSCEIN